MKNKIRFLVEGRRIMASRRLISLVFVVAAAGSAGAYTTQNALIEYWAGCGSNEAILVIDFGADSYAFGYQWDSGTKYGKDLMDEVAKDGAFSYNETGGFLNTISYDGYSNVGDNGWPGDWWSYFTSSDGETWGLADVGFAVRELVDGSWDGWAHQTSGDWPPAHSPTAPIPEPMTIALLGIGGLLVRRKKKGQADERKEC